MLNCLGEGEYSALMKHFLKRFPAGADRFAGVGTFTAANGVHWEPAGEDSRAANRPYMQTAGCLNDGPGRECLVPVRV